jgi:hypothetical protein
MSCGESRLVSIRTPGIAAELGRLRQLELERLPIGIQDHVEKELLFPDLRGKCQAVRGMAPVRLPEPDAMPDSVGLLEELVETEAVPLRPQVP